jgi:hypothetical protein
VDREINISIVASLSIHIRNKSFNLASEYIDVDTLRRKCTYEF